MMRKPSGGREGLRGALLCALALVAPAGTALAAGAEPGITFSRFDAPTIRRAIGGDKLMLLVLDVPWSGYAARARETLWTDAGVASALEDGFLAVRERADLRPDLMRRYPAEGWPAMTILLPDGTPMFLIDGSGAARRRLTSGYRPAEQLASWLRAARALYQARRDAVIRASARRIEAMARTAVPTGGTASRQFVWGEARAVRQTFDRKARYFGGPPRIPRFAAIELLCTMSLEGEPDWRPVALAAYETLATHLVDQDSGGLYRMSVGADWSGVQTEQLLDRNARWLELLARVDRLTGRRQDRERGLAAARFLIERLGNEDGSLAAGLCEACPGGRDETVIAGDVALAGAALIRAAGAFGEPELVGPGLSALEFVATRRFRPGRGVAREIVNGRPVLETDLEDASSTLWGFVTAYEATGRPEWLERAEQLARWMIDSLRDRSTGAMADVAVRPSGPPPLRIPLFPIPQNARAARGLVRLSELTGHETYRRVAQGIVDAFSGGPPIVGLWRAELALAAHDLLFDREEALVVGRPDQPRALALARAALGAEAPRIVVRWVDPARPERAGIPADAGAAAPVLFGRWRGHLSRAIDEPAEVRGALAFLIERTRKSDRRTGREAGTKESAHE